MNKFLSNLTVRGKFLLLSSTIIGLFIILTFTSIYSFGEISKLSDHLFAEYAVTIETDFNAYDNFKSLLADINKAVYHAMKDNKSEYNKVRERIVTLEKDINGQLNTIYDYYVSYLGEDQQKTLKMKNDIEYFDKLSSVLLELDDVLQSDNVDNSIKLIANNVSYINSINDHLKERQIESILSLTSGVSRTAKITDYMLIGLIILSVFIVVLSIVFTLVISNLISKNVKDIVKSVEHFEKGNFDEICSSNQKDELGLLSRSIRSVADTVENLIEDCNNSVIEFSEVGVIKPSIDTEKYSGAYKEQAEKINFIFEKNEVLIGSIIDTVLEVSKGNLDVEVVQLPGEQYIATEIVENTIKNISNISSELNFLISNVQKGDLNVNSRHEEFTGEWKNILLSFNNLIDSVKGPFSEIKSVLSSLSEGKLDLKMEQEYEGEFEEIKQYINNSIDNLAGYISTISNTLSEIGNKNLDVEITEDFNGDFIEIKNSINGIIEILNTIFTEFLDSAEELSNVSTSLTNSNISVANGSVEQVSTIEELNSSISVIKDKTLSSTENAVRANEISAISKESAINGDKEMRTMLQAMDDIKETSSRISNIIKVIDDIAFQTNLLSLNASVEAARAGQHGKGFAVVAEEVRNLANRSKIAAEQTNELITESLAKVSLGSDLANSTATSLKNILNDVTSVSDLLDDISASSKDQFESISEISSNLTAFEDVIQNNTLVSEQGVASAESLSTEAEAFKNTIKEFQLS